MRILDRLLLREFFKPLAACLVAFLLCMMVYDLYDNIQDFITAKVPFATLVRYYGLLVPAWLVQVMPITLLLSLLYALSDMSKHGELTAMRASGLWFGRLMFPFVLLGLFASAMMGFVSLAWAPGAYQSSKDLFDANTQKETASLERTTGIAYRDVRGNRFWVVSALDSREERASGVEIVQGDERKGNLFRISAATGVYRHGFWTFENVIIYDYRLPPSDPASLRKEAAFEARDFTESPRQLVARSRKPKRIPTAELLENLRYASRLPPKLAAIYGCELHGRIAYPFACLVVVFIGVPFGVIGQRRSTLMAVVNALLVFFGYLFFCQTFLLLGQSGRLPAVAAAWLPNFLFAGIGLWRGFRLT
ncbi:MAG: LptF/LptG family permease [Verrucomicrobiae bacterium]|nr:LptF/LptG family permease [Verrucomicrobiae bacterium]